MGSHIPLDPIRDMTPIHAGKLNNLDHLGLKIRSIRKGTEALAGHLIGVEHGYHTTLVKVRIDGNQFEQRCSPTEVLRIEEHRTWEADDDD